MDYGILRVACTSPALSVADCEENVKVIAECVTEAQKQHVQLLVFPELSLTGYTCADLFLQKTLYEGAISALEHLCSLTKHTELLFCVGLPVISKNKRYNAAAFIQKGKVLAVIPKTYIPTYSEFYERRWFTPAEKITEQTISLSDKLKDIPFGTDLLLVAQNNQLVTVAAEICEDLWVPLAPSTHASLAGASVIANLSASNEVVGKAAYRSLLVSAHSAKTVSAYLYADAGHDESSTDMVFAGHNIIAANGSIKAQSQLFSQSSKLTVADIDMEALMQDRLRTTTFADCSKNESLAFRQIEFTLAPSPFENKNEKLLGKVEKKPFVPESQTERKERCLSVIELQAEGLAKRLRHIHCTSAVIGLSGGLDSTLALLVTARAFDKCGIDRKNISAVTMPCFGTTGRTYRNACALAQNTGATLREIDIKKAVLQHFEDIGHDKEVHDVTYENCQARERTQVLMDIANSTNGIVIGTGDLSELALGWCTYNGDHMSMYGVNASIPKTLVRHLVAWFSEEAEEQNKMQLSQTLKDILDTPVSPELLPPTQGDISQKTEELVGPYELHDFFLYYVLRFGFSPRKIFFLARQAFTSTEYSREVILKWMQAFYKRFFAQQFKRSCMPDGAKVGTVNLSPRGDWRMPSDASARLWQNELEELSKEHD